MPNWFCQCKHDAKSSYTSLWPLKINLRSGITLFYCGKMVVKLACYILVEALPSLELWDCLTSVCVHRHRAPEHTSEECRAECTEHSVQARSTYTVHGAECREHRNPPCPQVGAGLRPHTGTTFTLGYHNKCTFKWIHICNC